MLHKPIPHSKKIGIIGLVTLFILGVFLLPMARAGIQKAPAEVAQSKAENVKDAKEIEAIKASIDSLQLAIQMKLDELHEKQAELELLREALNVKINGRGGSATTPDATEHVFAAVAPSDAGSSSEQPRGVGGMMMASVPGSSSAGPRGKQPRGGMMTAKDGPSSVPPPGKRPSGGMMMAAVPGSSSAPPPGQRPSGGMMMGALAMPEEPSVEQDSVLGEDDLPENISDEVRKELLRILPGLLREMLPKLLKEVEIKAIKNPSVIEKSP